MSLLSLFFKFFSGSWCWTKVSWWSLTLHRLCWLNRESSTKWLVTLGWLEKLGTLWQHHKTKALLKEIGKSGYVGISFELMHDALVLSLTYWKGNFNCISVKRKMEMISAILFLADNLAWTMWCSADLAGFRKKMFIWQLQVIVLRPCSWIAFSLRFLFTTKNAFGKLSVPFLLHLPLSPSPPPFIYHFPLPLPLVSSH